MGRLDGRVAIVTGAGSGVGREHARLLASEGASLVINDLGDSAEEAAAEIVAAGGAAVAHRGSVTSWNTGEELIALAVEHFGDAHIVINNAGILRDKMSFSMTEEEWDSVIAVHLKGHFVCARAAAVYWREEAKQGREAPRRLIHTTSESGLFGNAGQTNYGAAKGGILTMSIAFARELQKYQCTSNCIAPRARTPLTLDQASMAAPTDPNEFDVYDPANVSPFVVWLCTDAAANVSGQTFIAGGSGVWLMQRFSHVNHIKDPGRRLTLDDFDARAAELFGDHDTGVPAFEAPNFR
ncbi:MAG: SDR family oxidoreductase [Acidimicrobiales bacterium]|nr:SDR family oxidoreductase [Acidimicrobiales bacterium]